MDIGALREYFSADEAKIAAGVWAGGFVTGIASKAIYNAIFAKNKEQADEGVKKLAIDVLIKGAVGATLYSVGKDNVFMRYMALGSAVSIIDSIANYFLTRNQTAQQAVQRIAVQVV